MKRHLYVALALLISASNLSCQIGCMDKSHHLHKKYDNKEYHYVHCTCPCEKLYPISPKRGVCMKCGHFRSLRVPLGYKPSLDYHSMINIQKLIDLANTKHHGDCCKH